MPQNSPTALIFELSGCLVDFGARTLPVALQRLHPQRERPALASTAEQALASILGTTPVPAQLQDLQQTLSEVADEHSELTPGAAQLLAALHANGIPCAWLDALPADTSLRLAEALPTPVEAVLTRQTRPWPAPDSCWQALSQLEVQRQGSMPMPIR
jgi:beta-phosphoglucomutase-like phosphatase (HAD superfamily)